MDEIKDPNIIDANPTKEFFIDMLIKDIPLIRAIIDLVDNSVDGAIRSGKSDFSDFWIRIELDETFLRITDNCGGMSVDVARDYAFRIGKSEKAVITHGSIGQFGVGMKRTFFKLGRYFKVESTTEHSYFLIDEDIERWKNKAAWSFEFSKIEESIKEVEPEKVGTIIEIKGLLDNVSDVFLEENFKTRLCQEIEKAHYINLDKGLSITFNGIPLTSNPLLLMHSDQIKPAFRSISFENDDVDPVSVKIYAGISKRNLQEGGWYIFCNGRMVLEADQNTTTGWGEGYGKTIPKYHQDFAYFRGYVFFESDNPSRLPWTTTKTGVDIDSQIYKAIRSEMIKHMRPIIDFLRKLAKEKSESDDTTLEDAVSAAITSKFFEVSPNVQFQAPEPIKKGKKPKNRRIQYSKPVEEIEKVKDTLKAGSLKEIGEMTFDYYMAMECEE